jgi:hypothetical protein
MALHRRCGTVHPSIPHAHQVQAALQAHRAAKPKRHGSSLEAPATVAVRVYFHVISKSAAREDGNIDDKVRCARCAPPPRAPEMQVLCVAAKWGPSSYFPHQVGPGVPCPFQQRAPDASTAARQAVAALNPKTLNPTPRGERWRLAAPRCR